MITHLEPDILECKVKWALESITTNKASRGDGIPVELFQILKEDAVSVALNMPANLENSAVAAGLEKVSFHFNPKERQCQQCSNYHTIALISHSSKVMLKILQGRLQQYVNRELPDVQAEFRKGRGIRDQLPTSVGSKKKQESSRKNIYFCFFDYAKVFDCVDHNKFCLLRNLYAHQEATVRTRLGKEYVKAVYCHPACLTYMQGTSCEMPGWMKHKLESRLPGEISVTQMTPPLWQKMKRN